MPTLLAPAKINLTLEVLARREDGYHTLRSLMVPIALYDRIAIDSAAAPSGTVDPHSLSSDNLVMRALSAVGLQSQVRVALEKTIPIGGGLGGGSSDAAAVLRAAMHGALGSVPDLDWLTVARSLGSDVPFFLCSTGAIVEGTGERVTAVGALPAWWTVVVKPAVAVATRDAYQLLDESRRRNPAPSRSRSESATLRAVDALQRGDFAAVQTAVVNDFHPVVLDAYPEVARAHGAMVDAGAPGALLSGSGSCLFALFEGEGEARACALHLEACGEEVFLCALHHDEAWRAAVCQ